ncbi:transcriptional regulator, partial [Xanthomonas citri pv. citri]|nr:transcriptional regulator [Xanthomonas citri pv. citri]
RMSFHLATLERASLLRSWRDGRRVLYAASYEDMRQLLEFLTEDCCSGNPDICGALNNLATPCPAETCA